MPLFKTANIIVLALLPTFATIAAAKPNVLFILADDLGRTDLAIEGSTFYETPNLDNLAKESTRFEYGYANCQVCSPSRASIMTGKYPARLGITDWIGAKTGYDWDRNDRVLPAENEDHLQAGETTLAEAFRAAGYSTFFAGKWHLGGEGSLPEDHGFDINKGGHHRGSPPGGYFSPFENPKLEDGPDGQALPIRLAEETSAFIKRQGAQPFFAFLSFYSVHGPIQTSQPLWQKYREKASGRLVGSERFLIDRTLPVRQVQDCPIYAGMIETMDTAIGYVLDTLVELGIEDNTIVVFTSDNGGVTSGDSGSTASLPYRGGKGRQWEGGIREPYYIKAPGVSHPGYISDVPATGIDFFPTLLELAGIEPIPEQHIDGVSLVPALSGEGSIPDRPLFWHYPHYGNQGGEPSSIVTEHPWKLIHYYEDGRDELYNIVEDIGELHDQAKSQPQRVIQMRKTLDAHLTSVAAKIPLSDPRFDPELKIQRQEEIRTVKKGRLEKKHAHYLDDDYRPNPSWWGSESESN